MSAASECGTQSIVSSHPVTWSLFHQSIVGSSPS
jgi:hypothetical protein